jgi:hypothetical protein
MNTDTQLIAITWTPDLLVLDDEVLDVMPVPVVTLVVR